MKWLNENIVVINVGAGTFTEFGFSSQDRGLIRIPVGWEGGIKLHDPCKIALNLKKKEWFVYSENGRALISAAIPPGESLPILIYTKLEDMNRDGEDRLT